MDILIKHIRPKLFDKLMILVVTSVLFSVPAIIAFARKRIHDGILASSLTICSTLNHSKVSKKNKVVIQKLDIGVAHCIGVYYSLSSMKLKHISDIFTIILALNTAYLYHKKVYKKNNHLMHAIMHVSVIIGWSSYILLKR